MFKKKNKVVPISPKKEDFNNPQNFFGETDIYSIAIVLDGKVQDVIRAETRLAAMLLSDPMLINVTDNEHIPHIGWEFIEDTGEFVGDHE